MKTQHNFTDTVYSYAYSLYPRLVFYVANQPTSQPTNKHTINGIGSLKWGTYGDSVTTVVLSAWSFYSSANNSVPWKQSKANKIKEKPESTKTQPPQYQYLNVKRNFINTLTYIYHWDTSWVLIGRNERACIDIFILGPPCCVTTYSPSGIQSENSHQSVLQVQNDADSKTQARAKNELFSEKQKQQHSHLGSLFPGETITWSDSKHL